MATKANLVIDQGTDYTTVLTLTDEAGSPLILTGSSANSQIRKTYTSNNSVSFAASVNADAGEITLTLTAGQTSNMEAGRYVYDVELRDISNTVTRVVEGVVTVTPQVTR